jgi:hypothetical protein
MKDTIKITGDVVSPVLDEKEWEGLKGLKYVIVSKNTITEGSATDDLESNGNIQARR